MSWVLVALGAWALGWWVNSRLAASPLARTRGGKLAVPVIFGLTILILWEGLVRGLNVSPVILPPPSAVAVRFAESLPKTPTDKVEKFRLQQDGITADTYDGSPPARG